MKRKSPKPSATINMVKPSRKDVSRRAIIEITELNNEKHGVNIDFKDSQVRDTGSRPFDALCYMIKSNIEDMCNDLKTAMGDRLSKQQQKQDEVDTLILEYTLLKKQNEDLKESLRKLALSITHSGKDDRIDLANKLKDVRRKITSLC